MSLLHTVDEIKSRNRYNRREIMDTDEPRVITKSSYIPYNIAELLEFAWYCIATRPTNGITYVPLVLVNINNKIH